MNREKRHSETRRRYTLKLQSYDYSQSGSYFVTMCTHKRKCLFGHIVDGQMELSRIGKIARGCRSEIPEHFRNTQLNGFMVMPNHIHGIIFIVGVQCIEPLQNQYQHIIPKSIGSIIRAYKAAVTRRSRNKGFEYFRWQRNYEHIIRSEKELGNIREYMVNNPLKWKLDRENPFSINSNLGYSQYFKGIYEKQ